jgi:glucokinase
VKAPVLVGDVGGTNARFAISDRAGSLREIRTMRAQEHDTFSDALGAYQNEVGGAQSISLAAARIAGAGPVEPGGIALTNSPWRILSDEVSNAIGGGPVFLFNDLEAVALALPHLEAGDLSPLGPAVCDPLSGPLLALNVGTGFGAATAFVSGSRWYAAGGEPGHMTFAARTSAEIAMLSGLECVEDVLSGSGLVRVYKSLRAGQGLAGEEGHFSAAEILARAGEEPMAQQTERFFADVLARVAGDLVLALGAWGGVFFCGSVARAWAQQTDTTRFRRIFAAKGKMSERMQRVATHTILAEQPALFGLTFAE